MKIAIFHPQINNYGGGETVALTVASFLSKKHDVEVLCAAKPDPVKLSEFFGLDLAKVQFKVRRHSMMISKLPSLPSYKSSLNVKYLSDLNHYDLVIDTGTNGWFSSKLKAKTICYIHFPYFPEKKGWKKLTSPFLVNPKNAFQYDSIVCNSEFTKRYTKKFTDKEITVISPPVDVEKIRPGKKKNIIVTVGRFSREKKHEIMIDAFKKMKLSNWEFHLIGSFQENNSAYDAKYFEKLKQMASGAKIYFHTNMPHNKVLEFLGRSRIYWHARGYGETNPTEFENFGITTVEAMAAGCVPIVINLGAQPEIVKHGINGFVWNGTDELIALTNHLIADRKSCLRLQKGAISSAKNHGAKKFADAINVLIAVLFN